MPATSRAFVKASLLYLCLGSSLGALFLLNRWVPLEPRLYFLRVSHVQCLIVGWLTQLIIGVGWWLFPPLKIGLRPGTTLPERRGQTQRGSEPLLWVTFFTLNTGILLAAVGNPLYGWTEIEFFRALTGLSGLFFLAAAVAFVANVWHRIRELGRDKQRPS